MRYGARIADAMRQAVFCSHRWWSGRKVRFSCWVTRLRAQFAKYLAAGPALQGVRLALSAWMVLAPSC